MATQSAVHHVLAILAGDRPPGAAGDAAVDSLAGLMGHLGVARLRDIHRIHAVPFRTVEDR